MGRKRGRPRKDDGTRALRVHSDLADMVGWIVRIQKRNDPGYSVAQLVDPLLRPQITARFKLIEAEVNKIKKAEEAASEKSEEAEESKG